MQIMKVRHQMTIAEVRRRAEFMSGADPLDFISLEGPQWTHSEHQRESQHTHTEHHITHWKEPLWTHVEQLKEPLWTHIAHQNLHE